MKRRQFVGLAAAMPFANLIMNNLAFAEEDMPKPSRNRFLLYVHMGSICGVSSGLVQPVKPGQWPKGFFEQGVQGNSVNSLLNKHVESNGMVLNDYIKFLAPMTQNMCLVNGNSQSLDHNVAALYQQRGTSISASCPEWSMAVTEFMKTEERKNPMVLTSGVKTISVPDVTTVQASSIEEFARITKDVDVIPQGGNSPFLNLIRQRYAGPKLGTVIAEKNLKSLADYQLSTLTTGLKELNEATADIKSLKDAMADGMIRDLIKDCVEADQIFKEISKDSRDSLIMAGILAKTGLANGMSLRMAGGDTHNTASDIESPRTAGANWALLSLFWKWIVAQKLQDDVLIVVSHDFSRSAYNGKIYEGNVLDANGKNQTIKASGRDHSLAMGMMFINASVPKAGRIGMITDNMVPVATKDAKGTIDGSLAPYTAENIVGTMLWKVFPELFPTERMVRKHWQTFKEISPILNS